MNQEFNQTKHGDSSAAFIVDDRTMQIYTYLMFTALCQTINVFGIVTNVINIICFVKQGFTDAINVSLIGMLSIPLPTSLVIIRFGCEPCLFMYYASMLKCVVMSNELLLSHDKRWEYNIREVLYWTVHIHYILVPKIHCV